MCSDLLLNELTWKEAELIKTLHTHIQPFLVADSAEIYIMYKETTNKRKPLLLNEEMNPI